MSDVLNCFCFVWPWYRTRKKQPVVSLEARAARREPENRQLSSWQTSLFHAVWPAPKKRSRRQSSGCRDPTQRPKRRLGDLDGTNSRTVRCAIESSGARGRIDDDGIGNSEDYCLIGFVCIDCSLLLIPELQFFFSRKKRDLY